MIESIDTFWREVFPMFVESYDFIIVFFDVLTVMFILRIIVKTPGYIMEKGNRI